MFEIYDNLDEEKKIDMEPLFKQLEIMQKCLDWECSVHSSFIEIVNLIEKFYFYLEDKTMDKEIRNIEKTIKKDTKKEEHKLKHLEKEDKKRDKVCDYGEKMMKKKKK
jgi:hypothetical protein